MLIVEDAAELVMTWLFSIPADADERAPPCGRGMELGPPATCCCCCDAGVEPATTAAAFVNKLDAREVCCCCVCCCCNCWLSVG